jgi:hypothetical protein
MVADVTDIVHSPSTVRKWNKKPSHGLKTVNKSDTWEFEVGHSYGLQSTADNALGMTESNITVGEQLYWSYV